MANTQRRWAARALNSILLGFLFLALPGCRVVGAAGAQQGPAGVAAGETFESNGRSVPVEVFAPRAPGKHPVIVFAHGADGLQGAIFQAYYRRYARELAARGLLVVFPHYMDSTRTKGGINAEMVRNFRTWMQTLGDATTYATGLPNADPDRLGLMGISLGASLVMCQGPQDPRVKAIVEMSGALPPKVQPGDKRLAPLLILHGARDPLVNVQEAYKVANLLKAKGQTYEMKVYPEQGHGFVGAAHEDSVQRIATFFGRYLRVPQTATASNPSP
jgi:carboxymethylenebutenolidase